MVGSTVVALLAFGAFFACLWAGDSRLYRYRNGEFLQLSRDHSQVQEMVDAGMLTPEAAERHPYANIITRAVGTSPELELDKLTDRLAPDDLFLLCSDGLSKMVGDDEIAAILHRSPLIEGAARPDRGGVRPWRQGQRDRDHCADRRSGALIRSRAQKTLLSTPPLLTGSQPRYYTLTYNPLVASDSFARRYGA